MTDIVYNKNGVPFDIDSIATDLNGKLDTDCTNVSNTGYSKMAGASMPSDTYDTLTLGATGSTYTAPANGWFFCDKTATSSGQYLNLHTDNLSITSLAVAQNNKLRLYVPVKKGDVVTIQYTLGGTTDFFRFVYAEGEK